MVKEIHKRTKDEGAISFKLALSRKFLRVRLGRQQYCFRVADVKEIVDATDAMLEVRQGFDEFENLYGFMSYEGERIPVVDLYSAFEPVEPSDFATWYVVILDVVTSGFVLQLGIMTANLHDLLDASMAEMGESLFKPEN
jgi:chemotaxis signal transduction protein